MAELTMTLWVVYENPLDFPGRFVVRPQSVVRTEAGVGAWIHALHYVTDTLEQARKHIPPWLTLLTRGRVEDGEDPAVAETWV